jgi:copper chaperone NosL
VRGLRIVLPLALASVMAPGCGGVRPAAIDTRNDTCTYCRMTVSDPRLAAQIAGPGEEPRFFDDIGCLSNYLRTHPLSSGELIYVADHRTGVWVEAKHAVLSRLPAASTPMASGLIAHESRSSRDQDPGAQGGTIVAFEASVESAQPEASR